MKNGELKIANDRLTHTMKTKENKGVTLIALAVTIIIMLILAGVTISTLTGNSGISSNANQARIQNELAQYKEQMKFI
ncbi:MAG: type II secretion system protein [Clostridia bacterium]